MKFYFTALTLALALAMGSVYADETTEPSPVPDAGNEAPATVTSTSTPVTASAPATKSAHSSSPSTSRKVATDYAPAQDLLLSAMSLIGVKYKWGGATPESGLDCSGFVRYVFQNSLNIALPHNALGMSRVGDVVEKDQLKPGDLVFFNTMKRQFSHVGIYLGDGRFIHSPRTGRTVEVADMSDRYWVARFEGARRMSELNHDSLDIQALLQGKPARQPVANNAASTAKPEADGTNCHKITQRKHGKRVTTTICSRAASAANKVGKAEKEDSSVNNHADNKTKNKSAVKASSKASPKTSSKAAAKAPAKPVAKKGKKK